MKLIITPEQLETLTKENPNMTVLEYIMEVMSNE
ncbi:hypothetical protein TEMA_01450 [Terrisporobacter mayombei]|uniref:Uncharacterized protein n=1 Tax=Terrisporobacter mayombei TaxID=1541 RepID=A0ABY9PWV9_9FIRM|nr:hypothetical protein TEMA_01450 [Terrisporobacter mayombei]